MRSPAILSTHLLAAICLAAATGPVVALAQGPQVPDSQIQAEVNNALKGRDFSTLKSSVDHGVVTLTGTVYVLADKLNAERRVQRQRGVASIRDQIQLDPTQIPDEVLRERIMKKLTYVRQGYPNLNFDAFAADVKNGVVTLAGFAISSIDKSEAIDDVASMEGVRDIVDKIEVAPTSPNDDRLRSALLQAVYSSPMLSTYTEDPARPIRILVKNGQVTLVGSVQTQAQKDAAYIRANGVAGVFHVTNALQVADSTNR